MDFNQNEVIALTKQLISIESTNPGSFETNIGNFIYEWFSRFCGNVHRDEFAPGRFNVVAKLPGETTSPNFVLICHMDTVPVGNGWTRDPFQPQVEGHRLYGLGSCDMKAGLAAGMLVFREMVRKGIRPKRDLVFIASGDEEDIMEGAEQAMKSNVVDKDSWVLDLEPTQAISQGMPADMDGIITIAHKGKTWFGITTKGVAAHGSTPQLGVDAVAAMAEIIGGIRRRIDALPEDKEMGRSSVVFGTIQGGSNINVVPDTCTVAIDMRLAPPLTTQGSIQLVEEAIAEGTAKIPGSTAVCKVLAKRPYVDTDYGAPLLAELQAANEKVTGKKAHVELFPGYTDTGVIAGSTGNINCMSFGPYGEGFHKFDEFVDCNSVIQCYQVVLELAERVLYEKQ